MSLRRLRSQRMVVVTRERQIEINKTTIHRWTGTVWPTIRPPLRRIRVSMVKSWKTRPKEALARSRLSRGLVR